jgi:hypothetical protein
MDEAQLLDYISSIFGRLKGNSWPFGNMYLIVFGNLMQLPPVEGQKVFKSVVRHLFHPLVLTQPQRQRHVQFFNLLNKIRFGVVDNEIKEALTKRWQQYDPFRCIWTTTYLSSLKEEANALNSVMLSGMPSENNAAIFHAEDFENDLQIRGSQHSRLFRRGTNVASTVICKVGAKIMFLTNSMLTNRGISNGSIRVITHILPNEYVDAAFPTKDGIQVRFQMTKPQHSPHISYLKPIKYSAADNETMKHFHRYYISTNPMDQNTGVFNSNY